MSRRIEIELTSERPDGTWTWRAAGARQPKGEIEPGIVPEGTAVGDVVKAEADFTVDGIDILSVSVTKRARKEPDLIELIGSGRDLPAVTTQLVERKGRRRDRDRDWDRDGDGDRRRRRDRGHGGENRDRDRDRNRGDRDGGDRSGDRRPRRERAPERPRPKRLRAGRTHRAAVLDALPPEHQPIAEQVLRGGIPAVREAITKQNEQAKKENRPEIHQDQLVDLAEKLLPQLRAAEWRDRADAALEGIDEIDLRDLRSVIVAADSAGRDPEAMAIRDQIQEGLNRRVEVEHEQWIKDMSDELDSGRFIRVLRLTSRPPKAGTPIPVDVSSRLIAVLTERMTPELSQDLWSQTLDALAFSPIRSSITLTARPAEPNADLMETVKRVGSRLPEIAVLFGLDPEVLAAESKRSRPSRSGRGRTRSKDKSRDGRDRDGRRDEAESKDAKPADDEADSTPAVAVTPVDPAPSDNKEVVADQAAVHEEAGSDPVPPTEDVAGDAPTAEADTAESEATAQADAPHGDDDPEGSSEGFSESGE